MARSRASLVTLAAIFFFFITFAHGRAPLDLPENDVTTTHDVQHIVGLPASDVKITATNVVPSEKPETKILLTEIESKQEKQAADLTDSVPLAVITFRPLNHHFSRRPLFPFRRGHRCRQHHRFNQLQMKDVQRSYGDDMIVSVGADSGFDRRIPVNWAKHEHGGHGIFGFKNEEYMREINNKPRHHHHHHEEDEEEEEMKKHSKHMFYKSKFMKRIRKFLNNF